MLRIGEKKKKTGGGPAENDLDKFSNAITEMLPQQINSLQNAYDDDASLHDDEPEQDSEDECNDTREVSPYICLFVNLLLTAAVSPVNNTDRYEITHMVLIMMFNTH